MDRNREQRRRSAAAAEAEREAEEASWQRMAELAGEEDLPE